MSAERRRIRLCRQPVWARRLGDRRRISPEGKASSARLGNSLAVGGLDLHRQGVAAGSSGAGAPTIGPLTAGC